MHPFLLLLLLFCFFIFLFVLYVISYDDFVLVRKEISVEQLFNIAFLTAFVGLFSSRLLHVLFSFAPGFLNPVVFVLFPYFPGLSLAGGVLGAVLFLTSYLRSHRLPRGRIIDGFSVAFLTSLLVGLTISRVADVIKKRPIPIPSIIVTTLIFLFFIFFVVVLLPRQRRGELKDGTLGLLFLLSFSVSIVLFDILQKADKIFYFLGKEGIIGLCMFFASLILLVKHERIIKIGKKKHF